MNLIKGSPSKDNFSNITQYFRQRNSLYHVSKLDTEHFVRHDNVNKTVIDNMMKMVIDRYPVDALSKVLVFTSLRKIFMAP